MVIKEQEEEDEHDKLVTNDACDVKLSNNSQYNDKSVQKRDDY